ncbi:MAG: hypothetical protein KC502_18475 [Myxococcales bacterium]|nr:hypothetical protein [Myxococcales bacterium]
MRWLVALCIALTCASGCLPGKRDNTPTTDATVDAATDTGADSDEGADTVPSVDTAQPEDVPADDTNGVALPKGCSQDTDCESLSLSDCTVPSCDIASGLCALTKAKNGTACTLPDECIVNTTCKSGACTGEDKSCDDNNDCTLDQCVAFEGCKHTVEDKICNDGSPCTTNDICDKGVCKGSPVNCDSVDPCRIGSCNKSTGLCNYAQFTKAGTNCTDNNPCTKGDGCDGKGSCAGKDFGPKDCDDGKPCTKDSCNLAAGGCLHIPLAGPKGCSDGKPCTDDACKAGKCISTPVKCTDGKPCTKDACKPAANGTDSECTFTPMNGAPCTDALPCAAVATCNQGTCKQTKPMVCDDGNACTSDDCLVKAGGCRFLPKSGPCSDGNACTTGDKCKDSKCVGTPKDCSDSDPCTLDQCDPVTTKCSHPFAPEGHVCAPGKACKTGKCTEAKG